MGNEWWDSENIFYFNAPHRYQLGWYVSSDVEVVRESSTHHISPLNQYNPGSLKFLVIPRPFDPSNRQYYTVSFLSGENVDNVNRYAELAHSKTDTQCFVARFLQHVECDRTLSFLRSRHGRHILARSNHVIFHPTPRAGPQARFDEYLRRVWLCD